MDKWTIKQLAIKDRFTILYNLKERGRFDILEAKFGSIRAVYPVHCNAKAAGYEETKGFFEDMKTAYDFINGLEGSLYIHKEKNVMYTDLFALAIGKSVISIHEKDINLIASIRVGCFDDGICSVVIAILGINENKLLENAELFLTDYHIEKCSKSDNLMGCNDSETVFLVYSLNDLALIASPYVLEGEVPKVLEALLK